MVDVEGMDDKQIKHLVDNITLFAVTYLSIQRPRIPTYNDGEDAWLEFLRPAIEEYFAKQKETLHEHVFMQVPKPHNSNADDGQYEAKADDLLRRIKEHNAKRSP